MTPDTPVPAPTPAPKSIPVPPATDDGNAGAASAGGGAANGAGVSTPERLPPFPPVQLPVPVVEAHYTIRYGETGFSYQAIFGGYLEGATSATIEDPYIRSQHQIHNLVRFFEMLVTSGNVKKVHLITGSDDQVQQAEASDRFAQLQASAEPAGIVFTWEFSDTIHDREIRFDNGWVVKIGRGLDFYQKPDNWFSVGSADMTLRPCLETKVDIFRGSGS